MYIYMYRLIRQIKRNEPNESNHRNTPAGFTNIILWGPRTRTRACVRSKRHEVISTTRKPGTPGSA
jgi:hypothetical protein